MIGWVEMTSIHDRVVFGDQDDPEFDRARAWVAVLAGVNDIDLEDVRTELTTKEVDGIGTVPIVRWWRRQLSLPCSQCGQALLHRVPSRHGDFFICPDCQDLPAPLFGTSREVGS